MSDVTTGNPSLKYFCPPCITKVNPTTRRRTRRPHRSRLRKVTGSSLLDRHGILLGTGLAPRHAEHSHHAVIDASSIGGLLPLCGTSPAQETRGAIMPQVEKPVDIASEIVLPRVPAGSFDFGHVEKNQVRMLRHLDSQFRFVADASLVPGGERLAVDGPLAADHERVRFAAWQFRAERITRRPPWTQGRSGRLLPHGNARWGRAPARSGAAGCTWRAARSE